MKSIALYYSTKNQKTETTNGAVIEPETNVEGTKEMVSVAEGDNKTASKANQKGNLCAEFHVNIWKVEEGRIFLRPRLYLDFGVLFPKSCKALCFYLPFEIEDKIIDLSDYLSSDKQTLSAVFNTEVKCWANGNQNFYNVIFPEDTARQFYLYKLGDLNIEKKAVGNDSKDGIFLTIKINGEPSKNDEESDIISEQIYVRFRLVLKKTCTFVRTEHISNDLLQAAFSSTDLYDIRINESRVLSSKIKEQMELNCFQPFMFEKLHLFYMVDTRENVDNGSSLKQDTRIVEKEQWGRYLPESSLHNTTFVAYHWKKRRKEKNGCLEAPFESFNVFFSTIYPKTNGWRLAAYTFVVIMLGFLGSMLSFHLNQLTCAWGQSLVRPAIIVIMLVFVLGYFVKQNFGGKGFEIFRKR